MKNANLFADSVLVFAKSRYNIWTNIMCITFVYFHVFRWWGVCTLWSDDCQVGRVGEGSHICSGKAEARSQRVPREWSKTCTRAQTDAHLHAHTHTLKYVALFCTSARKIYFGIIYIYNSVALSVCPCDCHGSLIVLTLWRCGITDGPRHNRVTWYVKTFRNVNYVCHESRGTSKPSET